MPGRRLNDDERGLLNMWRTPPGDPCGPYLASIAVSGGLRGIEGLLVPFRYPITAICGRNGVGKSTILALAALAYHSPPGWHIPNWFYQPRGRRDDRSYYTFGDFLHRSSEEKPFEGTRIAWEYRGSSPVEPVSFRKTASRWGRYTARPEREVGFFPVSRVVPAYEVAGVRAAFSKRGEGEATLELTPEEKEDLSYIMGREYSLAQIQTIGRHTLQRVSCGVEFTSFNMGSGESCVVYLLHALHNLPRGGLMVVEEVESGLHPEAQIRLARILIRLCLRRQVQVICSTHSEAFLDALPRVSRILLSKRGHEHEAFESPSTRFAMQEMTGVPIPELMIYCEDEAARSLIEEALPYKVRVRVSLREIGDHAAVVRQGVSHLRAESELRAVCVLDGDCSMGDVGKVAKSEAGGKEELRPECMLLPGGLPPERWVAEQLRLPSYRDRLAKQFDCRGAEADSLIDAIHSDLDHHDLGYCLGQRTNLPPSDCLSRTMRAVAPEHPALDGLRDFVQARL